MLRDQATALSFLSLPPEVRLQIYGHLLVHSSSIKPQFLRDPEYYSGIKRAERALSNSRPHPVREFSPESAILRTCRQIHLEAMPVLYGVNTFLYSCDMSIFNDDDYRKVGFPDQNLQRIKHLELQVQPKHGVEDISEVSVAATIQYFVNRGCDLQTFELSLNELESDDPDDGYFDDDSVKHDVLLAVAHSMHVSRALAELKVWKTFTISLSYSQKMTFVEHITEGTVSDGFLDLVQGLARRKNFTITQKNISNTERIAGNEDREDDGSEDSDDDLDEDDPENHLTSYKFSWCLRPLYSTAQTDGASA